MATNPGDAGSGTTSNAVLNAAGNQYLLTIGRESQLVQPGTLVVTAAGDVVPIEDAVRGGATIGGIATQQQIDEYNATDRSPGAGEDDDAGKNQDGGGGSPAPAPAPDVEDVDADSTLPKGYQVWKVDGKLTIAYEGDEGVWLTWQVDDEEQLETLTGGEYTVVDKGASTRVSGVARDVGGVRILTMGIAAEIADFDTDPLALWARELDRLLDVLPQLQDPEIASLLLGSLMEGESQIDPLDIAQTEWWKSRSRAEREALTFALQDPGSYRAMMEDPVSGLWAQVRAGFVNGGYQNPPEELVRYYATLLSTGAINGLDFNSGQVANDVLTDLVARETDPSNPNASPFAGQYLRDGWRVIKAADGRMYVRDEQGRDWLIDGEGQAARYSYASRDLRELDDLDVGTVPLAPEARYVIHAGEHYLELPDGRIYKATGPGQIREMARLYGDPDIQPITRGGPNYPPRLDGAVIDLFGKPLEQFVGDQEEGQQSAADGQHVVGPDGTHYLRIGGRFWKATGPGQLQGLERLYGPAIAVDQVPEGQVVGAVVDLFGEGGIELFGDVAQAGTVSDLIAQQGSGSPEATALGEEEVVRDLVLQWLGPMLGSAYLNDDGWITREAGTIRNNTTSRQGAIDVLTDKLRRQRQAALPGYDSDLSYDDIAGTWRSLWQRKAGQLPDEESDMQFLSLLQSNDYNANAQKLTELGMERGWSPVVLDASARLGQAFGNQVRQGLY